jgi:hypothetical protein
MNRSLRSPLRDDEARADMASETIDPEFVMAQSTEPKIRIVLKHND